MVMLAGLINRWKKKTQGSALVESAILFPVLMTMLFGVYDIGHAITVNHKMITASQVAADLVTRSRSVSEEDINQAIEAAGLAMAPYADSSSIGIDIISVRFDDNDDPKEVWRRSRNLVVGEEIDSDPNKRTIDKSKGLGTTGEGAMIVTVIYDYVPTFGSAVIKEFRLRETAFARGRRSSVVSFE